MASSLFCLNDGDSDHLQDTAVRVSSYSQQAARSLRFVRVPSQKKGVCLSRSNLIFLETG